MLVKQKTVSSAVWKSHAWTQYWPWCLHTKKQ